MVTVLVITGMILFVVGGLLSVYWDECKDWYYEQIDKSDHQIVRKWKSKYASTIYYNWECTCGKHEWSGSKPTAYNYFVRHRAVVRKEAKLTKEIEETEGW